MQGIRDRIKDVMAEVFEIDAASIADDATADDVTGWDSLHHLELMLALESAFGAHIPSDAMLELTSIEAIALFLQRAGAA